MNIPAQPIAALRLALVAAIALLVCGCAGQRGSAEVSIAKGDYARAFDAARDMLVASRFTLERVDAREGVITTRPKHSSGLATPWDAEQSTLDQEFDDLVNHHDRRVRIAFEPVGTPADTSDSPSSAPPDLRRHDGPVVARVEVWVERLARPGWRVDTTSVRLSPAWRDPALQERGIGATFAVPTTRDDALAAQLGTRLADRIKRDTR
ncbi:MAG: hypothetical protein ACKVW3_16165 [Phycisphaerales bacterium]